MERTIDPASGALWRAHYAHPCAWDQSFAPLSLPDMLLAAATAHPDRALIEFYGRNYSYAAVLAEARRFAAGLQRDGLGKGDRVGLFLPNVPAYVPAYYGAMLAGATVVNFSPLYSAEELAAQIADSGTRLMVTLDVPALLPTAISVLRETALSRLVVARLAAMLPWARGAALRLFGRSKTTPLPAAPDIIDWRKFVAATPPTPVAIDAERDIALLQYTGGTTGTPKGAMLSHQNLTANARQIAAIDPHRGERDVIVGALPLFHVFANACVLNRTVADCGCIAMVPRFDAGQVLKTIARVRATAMPGVPTMFQALADHPGIARGGLGSLRVCISGGAPLAAPLKSRFETLSGAVLVEGYGLTESSGVVSTNPYEGDEHIGTIGQPLPATRLRLLDRDDPTRDAVPGEPGELAVLGPQVMCGYWNRPEAERDAFAERIGAERSGQAGVTERWLRTGDIATIAADGFVRIVDRAKDMITVGGFKVYPSQVEAVLLAHPAVREALVIGMPDARRGEMPRAFVTLKPDAEGDAAKLRDWLNARVGKHERVDAVVLRETLPKTMIGKLDRKALRAEVGG